MDLKSFRWLLYLLYCSKTELLSVLSCWVSLICTKRILLSQKPELENKLKERFVCNKRNSLFVIINSVWRSTFLFSVRKTYLSLFVSEKFKLLQSLIWTGWGKRMSFFFNINFEETFLYSLTLKEFWMDVRLLYPGC